MPISFRFQRHFVFVLLTLSLITLTIIVINASWGEYPIPPLAVVQTIFGIETGNSDYAFVIKTLRLPRSLTAALVGIALGISGTILQGITRNALAAPGIIGVNAGASLAAVSLIVVFPDIPVGILPLAAGGGALLTSVLIYFLAWEKGTHPVRLILVGVGIAAVVNAMTNLIVTFGEINNVSQALVWLAGSVYGCSWEQVFYLSLWLLVFIPLALFKAPQLNTLNLGEEIAKGLGTKVELEFSLLLLISAALAGAAVATAGSIGFVGLIAPHLARQLVGNLHESLIPIAAMIGATIVVMADFLGRILFAPIELPCGIITALIGTPYFVYLLVKNT
ncbi:MAG: iron ABC transporter permease [Spirulinaceae cyanobacterium]